MSTGFTKSLAMTVLSEIGDKTFFAAALSRTWTHHITTLLFFGFGLWSLWDGFKEDGDDDELAEVEAKLGADLKAKNGTTKEDGKAFSITFFGEWGDRSQIATIGLAADENPFGVVLGGILGQALCTIAAVIGGKSLASQISEKIVALAGGVLFLVFGIQSFLTTVE
ncbi:hypothetical protein Tsubulata_045274 [Turnera subulata]|uniref:GDT1 family protein n=1 Tax=Turnera subulata TaxID=218843 RepID=A0A9Q0F735_9ROSI|nr:hypothetical protein Tsubulata_045274 [Turnera subulata]